MFDPSECGQTETFVHSLWVNLINAEMPQKIDDPSVHSWPTLAAWLVFSFDFLIKSIPHRDWTKVFTGYPAGPMQIWCNFYARIEAHALRMQHDVAGYEQHVRSVLPLHARHMEKKLEVY